MSISDYIYDQSQTVGRTIDTARSVLKNWEIGPYDRVLLVGSGSSLNALHIVMPTLRSTLKRPVEVMNPAVLLRDIATLDGMPLVVILSQSGMSTTSIEIAAMTRDRGWQTIIVTADLVSPIAQLGLPTLPILIGAEPIGPKTKGFTASIAACLMLAEKLDGQGLPAFSCERMAELLSTAAVDARALLDEVGTVDYIVVSGSERFFGVALEASLKISEIAGIGAAGFEPEELLHGRLHGMNARSCGIMIAADKAERDVAARTASVMAERNVRIVIVNLTDEPTDYDWFRVNGNQAAPFDAIAATIPFQWLAVELALRRNMVPDLMQYPGLSKALAIKTQVR